MKTKPFTPVFLFLFFTVYASFAFQEVPVSQARQVSASFEHNDDGFQFTSPDEKHQLQIQGRLQFRFATPYDPHPVSMEELVRDAQSVFKINRARLKIGGYSYQPWLKYYLEYDVSGSRLLDFRIMVEKFPWLKLKLGQWKAEYSRERSISSGEQQMMDRSIVNRPFTLDRQQGVSLYGHLDGPGAADFNYNLFVLTGNGRGRGENDDDKLMYAGKFQWNVLGDGVNVSGSDLEYHEKPAASLAWAGATNTSQFTRFSSSGGGNLEGYEEGVPGQYKVEQWLLETAFKYRSLSVHGEYHQKGIADRINNDLREMDGWFGQAGYILNHRQPEDKALVELAMRYARFRPDVELPQDIQEEFSLAVNCFFNKHLSKLTADVTLFEFESMDQDASGWRFRLQYDFSF